MVVKMWIVVLWAVMPCSLDGGYQCLQGHNFIEFNPLIYFDDNGMSIK
jgi:hypothetical protein